MECTDMFYIAGKDIRVETVAHKVVDAIEKNLLAQLTGEVEKVCRLLVWALSVEQGFLVAMFLMSASLSMGLFVLVCGRFSSLCLFGRSGKPLLSLRRFMLLVPVSCCDFKRLKATNTHVDVVSESMALDDARLWRILTRDVVLVSVVVRILSLL